MTQQLFAAKKPCNNCGGLIAWDKALREKMGTNLPLNLDRTIHDRASCEAVRLAHPGLPTENVADVLSPPPPPPKQTQLGQSVVVRSQSQTDTKTEAIAQAFERKMKSEEENRDALDGLSGSIKILIETIAEASEDSKQSIYSLSEEVTKLRTVLFDILRVYTDKTP